MLASLDIDLRVAAGETIALFYELGRSDNEVSEYCQMESLYSFMQTNDEKSG